MAHTKNITAEPIREEYNDSVRERIRDRRGELSPMPGEPAIIALNPSVLPEGRCY